MRKLWTALLTFAIFMAAGMCAMAGTFDEYWDFEQEDGTYAYAFSRIKIPMDENWYQRTRVVPGKDGLTASFYHKGSYNAYADEGMTGGLLFTIGASVNTDFRNLPSFVYLGFDEEEAMNYYASLPTDYQAYMGDEAIRKEYDELWEGVEDVLDGVEIKGSGKFGEPDGSDDDPETKMPAGEWETTEDPAVTRQARMVFDLAMSDYDGKDYDAVALLATQAAAGKNYCFLCRTGSRDSDEMPAYQLAYIRQDPQGDVHVLEVKDLELGLSEKNTDRKPEKDTPRTPVTESRKITSGDYEFLIHDKTATITKYTGDADVVPVPSEIDGYRVTEIGAEAFRYRKMKSVSIPGSISTIGRQAFEYCEITDKLSLPAGVTISEDAFSYAVLPAVVTVPEKATVKKCAFSYCEAVKEVCIDPGAVLKGRAFGYCDDITQVLCAEGSRLEKNAFEYCRRIEKVYLCGDVQTAEEAFSYCPKAKVTEAGEEEYTALKRSAQGESSDDVKASFPEKERTLEIMNSPAECDGVTVTLTKATAQKNDKNGFSYTFSGTIENNSDEGIMQVIYTFALIDENGEKFRSFGIAYDGEDTALAPHAAIDFFHDDIRWGKQSIPAAVEIGISSVKTETELPPEHVPEEGEYLYQALGDEKLAKIKEEPPVELTFHVDQGGYGRTATFTEGEALDKAVELFCEIRIGEEAGQWVTDNYNGIGLSWADGSYTGISLNLDNLEYWVHSNIHTYELENLDEFWSYCADYLEEDHAADAADNT